VILGAVTLSFVGMEMSCLLALSMTLRIEVCPLDAGSCSMRSKEIECHGHSGIGSYWIKLKGLCLGALFRLQETQLLM